MDWSSFNLAIPPYLNFNFLVAGILFRRYLLLEAKVVKVEVSGFSLGGFSTEVVARMSNRFSFGNENEEQDSAENTRIFRGENSQSLGPVGFNGCTREVQSKAKSVLYRGRRIKRR